MNYYNSALQKIQCAQNQFRTAGCCCFGMTGPTGPTGPAGPATITVGTTTTGLPGTPATVTNVGTTENAILNFTIPQGITGPTGATGATGPIGPAGPAATFTVAPTVTVDPDTPASVAINGTDGNYTLTFSIPQGVTGPTGATGNGLAAYGGIYNDGQTNTLTLNTASATTVPMTEDMALSNVTAADNTLTVAQAGDYEITYFLGATASSTVTDAAFAIQQNGQDITGTAITDTIDTTDPTIFTGNIIVPLDANAEITMTLTDSASGGATVTVSEASLVVKKLDTGITT